MEILYACWCGIDVQAKRLVACLIKQGKKEVRPFSTRTADLLRLRDWLAQEGGEVGHHVPGTVSASPGLSGINPVPSPS